MNQPLVKLGQGDHVRDGATEGAALLVCACASLLALVIVISLDHQVSARADTQLTTASGDRPCGAATPGAATNPPTMPAGPATGRPVGLPTHQGK